jgi:Flp pilus assembly protein TadD
VSLLALYAVGCSSVARQQSLDGDAGGNRNPPKVELDGEAGFTIVEVVTVGSDVRNDYQRAMALLERNELEAGIAMLEAVIEQAPELVAPRIDLGIALMRLGELVEAEASLVEALSLMPEHPAALNELGLVYRRTGRFDEARASYDKALSFHPSFHYALLNLGVLCDLYLQDLACALDSFERYGAVVADDPQVEIWIADVRNRLMAVR